MNSDKLELLILNIKNPYKILDYCNKTNFWIEVCKDSNGFIWHNLIIKYYYEYYDLKLKNLSLKDYYVLLYCLEQISILNNIGLIEQYQTALLLLPKIYEGDHVALIHGVNNIAIQSNKAKLILYRKKEEKSPVFGSGYLRIRYLNNTNNVYIDNESKLQDYVPIDKVDSIYGGYNPI